VAYDRLTNLAYVKTWLKLKGNDEDVALAALVDRASDLIGRYCGRDNLGGVYTYTENYFPEGVPTTSKGGNFKLMLRHYPVITLTGVLLNNSPVTILTNSTVTLNQAGVFIDTTVPEPRQLRFLYLWRDSTTPIQVVYTAGYTVSTIPNALQQAAIQTIVEMYKSSQWVGFRAKSLAGENVSFDPGEKWGLSPRTIGLIKPFINVVPDSWTGA
jgi:hypothetical protein